MEKKQKIILFTVIGLLIIGLGITIYFVIKSESSPYPKDPIVQNSLSSTDQSVALKDTNIEKSDGYLYTISQTVMLEEVKRFVSTTNSQLVQTIDETGSFYEWQKDSDYVIYELDQNTVIFSIAKGIAWNEASINGYSFTQFTNNYFGKNWQYATPESEKQATGETIYYSKRELSGKNIEMVQNHEETDYLAIKGGKIIYGKILLTEFNRVNTKLPLINSSDLNEYINLAGYPKDIYPDYSPIQKTILSDIDYKSDEFENITETLKNCQSSDYSIIYLYKSFNQLNLTPVYKLDLLCEVKYQNTMYSIPAIGYVNAIDPKYVSTAE